MSSVNVNIDDELVRLPTTTIQPTYTTVIQEVWSGVIPSEEIWLSRYHQGQDSTHDRIRVTLDDEDRDRVVFESTSSAGGGLKLSRNEDGSYTVDSTRLLVPVQTYSLEDGRPHRITSLAVSPDQAQVAIGLLDGTIFLYPVTEPKSARDSPKYLVPETPDVQDRRQTLAESRGKKTAHKSTITSLQFFPSSRVLLSAGADFTMRIWPAESIPSPPPSQPAPSPIPARTLTAHTRPITSVVINPLDRGRTVLSAGADGTVRLWNVSSGSEVSERRIRHGGSGVAGMTLDPEAKRLYCAVQDGSFEVFSIDLSTNDSTSTDPKPSERIFRSTRSVGGALTSIALSSSTGTKLLATGSQGGMVSLYLVDEDFRHLLSFKRNDATIEQLSFLPSLRLAISTTDGLPWIAAISMGSDGTTASVSPYAELTGGEIDAVRDIVAVGKEVWTACDDGVVRRYLVE
ncbi:hypothetical protein AAF712_013194 [Marasmius tenuissimus]|uniref:WD40 repeat-like protein n=1 Tax=Marasmius tenuissimus TaxID=585030 RepID=A0ABR2ZGD7_9AGAR|nr:hypothetical protein PM082_016898 [Marasmius tenuissimus]